MRGRTWSVALLSVVVLAASGCKKNDGDGELPPPPGFGEEDELVPSDEIDYSEFDEVDQPGDEGGDGDRAPAKRGEPEFTEGMSVSEAMDAASGTERLNIDQEALGAPFARQELFEPCHIGSNVHFDLRVAVWNGRAVGIDVETDNAKLRACIIEQVKQIRWKDKVKSLNTVEYSM